MFKRIMPSVCKLFKKGPQAMMSMMAKMNKGSQ